MVAVPSDRGVWTYSRQELMTCRCWSAVALTRIVAGSEMTGRRLVASAASARVSRLATFLNELSDLIT